MGLGDISTTIFVKHKHDTKDAMRELRKLRGEERARHKALIEEMEAQNKKIDDQIKFWGKVAVGIGAAVAAWKALDAGFETYEKNSRLRAANVNTDLQGLQRATRGLVDDTRLLEFSASAMNGTFKLTQQEVETVLQGAVALRKTAGVDLPVALDRLQQALREGSVEPLKELNIVLKEQSGTAGANQAIIREMAFAYQDLGGDVGMATDAVTRSKTDFANAIDSIQDNLGKVAFALVPIVEMMGAIAGYVADLFGVSGGPLAAGPGPALTAGVARRPTQNLADLSAANDERIAAYMALVAGDPTAAHALMGLGPGGRRRIGSGDSLPFLPNEGGLVGADPMTALALYQEYYEGMRRGGGARGGSGGVDLSGLGLFAGDMVGGVSWLLQQGASDIGIGTGVTQGRIDEFMNAVGASSKNGGAGVDFSGTTGATAAAGPTMLERILGPIDGFAMYEGAIASLAGSVGQMYSQIVDGSIGAGDAVKSVLRSTIMALGQEMAVSAVKYTGLGIASLALGPIGGTSAAAYFQAAGIMAGGAALAGVAAHSIPGGGGASAGAAPSVAGIGAGAAAGARSSTTVNLIGEDFGEMPARARVAYARRQARRAGIVFEGDAVERV